MNRQQLSYAQFLHNVATRGDAIGDQIDPDRTRQRDHVLYFDGLVRSAERAFQCLTGRRVDAVKIHELNTGSPADWTKSVVPWTWGQG